MSLLTARGHCCGHTVQHRPGRLPNLESSPTSNHNRREYPSACWLGMGVDGMVEEEGAKKTHNQTLLHHGIEKVIVITMHWVKATTSMILYKSPPTMLHPEHPTCLIVGRCDDRQVKLPAPALDRIQVEHLIMVPEQLPHALPAARVPDLHRLVHGAGREER